MCVDKVREPHSQLLPPIWSVQRLCHCYGSLSLRAFLLKKQKALPLNHKKRHLLGRIILSSTLFLTSQKIALNLEMSSGVMRIEYHKLILLNSLREEGGLF